MSLLSTVQDTIQRHQMLRLGECVLVGVSGGADSVCLLLVLKELGYNVVAAHLNHGLRGAESDDDETFVRDLAERLDVRLYTRRVDIISRSGNLEAEGRRARKEFFAAIMHETSCDRIALAHNSRDRAETFLLNLLRGSGPAGLTSMQPVSGNVVRPLIDARRSEIESFLAERLEPWRTDSSNTDRRFLRNRLRHEVLPLLSENFNPNVIETLNRTIRILDDEAQVIESLADEWINRHGTKDDRSFVLDVESLASKPVALQRRVLRKALAATCAPEPLQDVGFEHIESARELLGPSRSGKLVEIPGGLSVTRSFGRLIVERRQNPPSDFEYELRIPGKIHIQELDRWFRADIVSEATDTGAMNRVFVDGGCLGPYVRIRNWKPGDYYKPVGLPAGKLKKLFQRARVPRSARHRLPVVVADASIVWVASFPVSREFAPRGCSQTIVAFEAVSE